MSQRFIRCPHCRMPHDGEQVFCPTTGKPIRTKGVRKPVPEAPQSRRPPRRQLIGKTIGGKYKVHSVLGEGGMGTVFEAEHLALGRSVAVKVLHATQATRRDAVRRFQQEARAAGAIGHPNICGIIDLGTLDDGSPYMVMERLLGETLADRVASEGGLLFEDVIDILVQVLSGLVAAHEKGIVHRDIKPENVFLTTRVGCPPLVKLLDFGVSKMTTGAREDLSLTRTGMVMGTPFYMAPEQARGERDIDARVDLYACGVIMYEALTGKRPFTAANYNALLIQIQTATPRPARDLRPALPAAYDAVIERAMARDRARRYASAAEFQQDLQGLRDRYNAPRISASMEVSRVTGPDPYEPQVPDVEPTSPEIPEPEPSGLEIPITVTIDTEAPTGRLPAELTEALGFSAFSEDVAGALAPPPVPQAKSKGQGEALEPQPRPGDEPEIDGDTTKLMAPANSRRR